MTITLKSISKSSVLRAPKMALYGVPGIGKTTFAANAPSPIFQLTEDGLGKLEVPHFPLARSFQDVLDGVAVLCNEEHDYGTYVLDSLDAMEPMLWEHTSAKHKKDDIEAFGYGKGYIYATDELRQLLQGLDFLRNEKGMAVILIAHSEIKRFESPDLEPYDRYQMRLQTKANALVCDWVDVLLFASYRVHTIKDGESFGRKKARAVGKGERILHTSERPSHLAKNRYGLPEQLDLSWAAFMSAMNASLNGEQSNA